MASKINSIHSENQPFSNSKHSDSISSKSKTSKASSKSKVSVKRNRTIRIQPRKYVIVKNRFKGPHHPPLLSVDIADTVSPIKPVKSVKPGVFRWAYRKIFGKKIKRVSMKNKSHISGVNPLHNITKKNHK